MQQPPDDANIPPSSEAEPDASLSAQIHGDATLAAAPELTLPIDMSADASVETLAHAVPTADSRVPLAAVGDRADTLNFAERLVADVGAWASTLAERWTPSLGPFFASDGRTAVDSCHILSALDSELSATTR